MTLERKAIIALIFMFIFCTACSPRTATPLGPPDSTQKPILSSSSIPASSEQLESISEPITSSSLSTPELSNANSLGDNDQSIMGDSFWQLQQNQDIGKDQVEPLVKGLVDKAVYLCVLAQSEIYGTTELVYDAQSSEVQIGENGLKYFPVIALPYANTQEMWDDIYNVFSKSAANAQFAFMFEKQYMDFNGVLYCCAEISGIGKQRGWDTDTIKIENISDETITVQMNVQFRDDYFPAVLEIVYENGHWVLTDSYFTSPN